ncbi:UNVERIFIED_CONTAM: hypothetical protein Slati_1124300 [Sesamum latifolium]|uniref:Retrotransposon gag domain-containing protein n=1 Tax=Sesamum latifolium TaxID=2727402 RepID=A0AAW2XBT8_9LAMI
MSQNPKRTIKEMTSLDLNQQPLRIEYPTLDVDFELKFGLIHLLSTFRGLEGEDPHKHLKEFHVVCSGMRPQGVTEEQVKLRAFPFSLGDKAKDWLYSLPSGSIISWNELKKQFLENYFAASCTTTIRKEISGICQFFDENFHEYWGRFKHLVESCSHHQIPEHLLIQYFYEGLSETNRSLVDAASGGALYDKTPTEARKLITIMAANNQQFGKTQQIKACGIYTSLGHSTDACPTLHEERTMHANAVGGFFGPSQRGYDTFSNTYNPGWRDHPNLRYGDQPQNFQRPPYQQPPPSPQTNSNFEQGKTGEEFENSSKQAEKSNQVGEEHPKVFVPKPPFPERFAKSKKEEEEKEILETLCKVEVNIPLLDVIKRVSHYAKFLKEMCTNKSKLKGNEWVSMGENIAAILQRKLPPKYKDPGTFSILCKIENMGASINVMPLAIYESLNVGPLKETGVVLQLADRSIVYPKGVLEDVLVQVNELIFSTDLYVLDMMGDNPPNSTSILLGKSFLKTSTTKIDVDAGILSMEFDNNEVVSFSIGGVTHNYNNMHPIFLMDFIDPLVQGNAMFDGGGVFKMSINKSFTSSLRTYKNKVFHEKISSRKKPSMDHQVLLNPHHHRVHNIEEVDLERLTH